MGVAWKYFSEEARRQAKLAQRRKYRKNKTENARNQTRAWRERNPGHDAKNSRAKREEILRELVDAYGGKCCCCDESGLLFMTIDHIFNDGAVHRKTMGTHGSGIHIYRALRKAGYPKDRYQLMCFNCNLGKQRNGGVCPHQKRAM